MIRTGYSFRTTFGHLPDVIGRLKTIGFQCAPIADRCSTFAFNRWTKLARKAELRPVYGVELAVTATLGSKQPVLDYWTFMAIDSVTPLHTLIEKATSNPGKEPSLLYTEALAATGVFKITGARLQLDNIINPSDVYFGIGPGTPRGLYNAAIEKGLAPIAMHYNHYVVPEDRETYRVMLGRRSDAQTYAQHIMSDDEWRAAVNWFVPQDIQADALQNRAIMLGKCKAELGKATLLQPEKPATLRAMCIANAAKLECDLSRRAYAERLERELAMIAEKNFEDYFYIVADLVNWAKQRMIVGPARGSSAGSLVCYLLGITAIDPIPYGLLFERFIDVTRNDLPDIDIDFSDTNRQQVFDYAEQKFGADRVARLGTVNMFGPRSIFNQVGPALRIPQWRINKVLDSLIHRSSGDTRANQEIEDTLKDTQAGKELLTEHPEVIVAAKMEGHPSVAGQHAAGIVITNEPIQNYVAVDARTGATMCDKKDAAELNLLKIDALGLTQLSIFERTLELIGKPPASCHLFLESLPLDDAKAFEVLSLGHFAGVFQFMGGTLQTLVTQIGKVDDFNDLVAITALSRPGPMATGGATKWAERRAGRQAVSYLHEMLEPYLIETLGVITYQEQVMKIGRELGGLSWADVTALRKGMSQSLGQEYFDQYGNRWKQGAIAQGMSAETVDRIWFELCAFGSWGFNKSHAVAYSLVSYWCCWLKAHHPVEFAAATLDAVTDPVRQLNLLRELKAEGVDYLPFDKDASTARWMPTIKDGKHLLVGPLTSIKGIGPAGVDEILTARARGIPIRPALAKRLENAKTPIDTLYPVQHRVETIYPDLSEANILTPPKTIVDVQCGLHGQVVIIGVLRKLNLRNENEDVNVAKRGYKVKGPDASLIMFIRDDTDEIFCKIDRWHHERLSTEIMERGRAGKAIYAIKGTCPKDFRMIRVQQIKYIGDMEESMAPPRGGQSQDKSADSNTGIDQGASA